VYWGGGEVALHPLRTNSEINLTMDNGRWTMRVGKAIVYRPSSIVY
jgi:hypothetical protein